MDEYEHLTRKELFSLVQELKAECEQWLSSAQDNASVFPVFGEREQQQFEKSPWPMRIFDLETLEYAAINDAGLKLYGYSREEFLKLTLRDTRHWEEHAEIGSTLSAPTGYLRHLPQRRHLRKNGEIILVELVMQDVLFKGRKARLSLTIDVTERARMVELLRKREQEFSALMENAPDIIARIDRDFRHLYVNPAIAIATGLPPAEFIGKTIDEVAMPPDLLAQWHVKLRNVFATGREQSLETVFTGPQGARYYESRILPEWNNNGVETVLVITRDFTERNRAERELKSQKILLDTIIEYLPVGITVKDARSMRYLLRNRMVDKLSGYDSAQVIGKRADEAYPLDLAERIHASDREALASGRVVISTPQILRSNANRTVRNLKVPVPDETGQYTHLVSILDDVTDIEQTQAALRRSEQRLRQLISMSPAVIFSRSPDPPFNMTFVSENVTAQVGWQPSEFIGSPSFWFEHIHPDDQTRVEDVMARLTTEGKYRCEYRFLHKNGSWHWIRSEGQQIHDEETRQSEVIGTWMDVTAERWETEKRLERALHQRDTLVREVHHRIKNNIQGVIGLLRRKINKHPAGAPEIEDAIVQLQTIAMVYGIHGKGSDKALSLAAMLDSICNLAENFTGTSIARNFESAAQPQAYIVAEEAVAVAVALNELIFNALKHRSIATDGKQIRVVLQEEQGVAKIRVVNPGDLPLQFDFATGHGLNEGLDLVKALLMQPGSDVVFSCTDNEVETILTLRPPLLANSSVLQ